MKTRVVDFFYDNKQTVEGLMNVLQKPQITIFDYSELRVYKFIVAIKVLEEEDFCIARRESKKQEKTDWTFNQAYISIKAEMQAMGYTNSDLLFCEKVEELRKNSFFFNEYIEKELNDARFLGILWEFCENNDIKIHRQVA